MARRTMSGVETRDWKHFRAKWVAVLRKQTGKGLDEWRQDIDADAPAEPTALRAWLTRRGVSGYARQLLLMERFGYPDFVAADANGLIDAQYSDRQHLRPVYDAIVKAAADVGEIVIQARKGYVSILTPRRTFARVRATTKTRVDVGLRLDSRPPGHRLVPSRLHSTMKWQIGLSGPDDVDAEVRRWIRSAYRENE